MFAYPDEVDRWLEGAGADTNGENGVHVEPGSGDGSEPAAPVLEPHAGSEPPARARIWAVAVLGLVLLAAVVAGAWLWGPPPPARLAIVGNDLLALDAAGTTRWIYRTDATEIGPPEMRWSYVEDLSGDGDADPVASLEVRQPPATQHTGRLLAFSSRGDLRWSLTPDDRLTFREGEFGPPWPAKDLSIFRTGGAARIAWTVHHFTWFPGLLLTLDADGNRLGTFVNSGWIRTAVPSIDERRLLVTGTSNSRQASFLAILDAAAPGGHSPEPPGHPMECLDCPQGDPLEYYVLPRTDVSLRQPFPNDGPSVMTFDDGTWQVHALESDGPNIATVIYEFDDAAGLSGARFADSFWEWHRRLEQEGRLDHEAASCLHRRGLEIQRWTPAAGWETLPVPVR